MCTNTATGDIGGLVYVKRGSSFRGWKPELFIEEIRESEDDSLVCSYCKGVLRDGCSFKGPEGDEVRCSACIPTPVEESPVQMKRGNASGKMVNCPLKDKGCGWTSELSEVLHHLEECEVFPVACPLGCRDERGEVSRVERRGLEVHNTFCPMRTVKCEYCSCKVKFCLMEKHQRFCGKPNTVNSVMKTKRISFDFSKDSPLQEAECHYSQFGCEVKLQRRQMDLHEKEEIHTHLKLTVSIIEKLQSKVAELEKVIEEMKSPNSELKSHEPLNT